MKTLRIISIIILSCLTSASLIAKESQKSSRSKVDKKWERKADKNNDGLVSKKEVKAYRLQKSKVDKPWEKKADADNDGFVSKKEAEQYRKKANTE